MYLSKNILKTVRKINPHFIMTFIFCVMFFSCEKQVGDTQGSITGKWFADSIQARQSNNNVVSYTTVYRYTTKTDYWDYRSDNKLYRYNNGNYDTIPYTLGQDNYGRYIQYSTSGADSIKTLTDNLLVLIVPQGSSTKLFFSK